MSSSRSIARALVVAVVAALSAVAVAHGKTTAGQLGGYVTDADTGLGLGGASVAWQGGTPATSESTGRYLFSGLTPGSTGTLSVTGPAGYEHVDVPNVTLPGDTAGTQNVAVHRVWSSSAGGATITANDESGAAAGCGSAQAVDGNPGTGWSATVAQHGADDPAEITIALPQTIDVRRFVLDPSAACGHAAGAGLGGYRILTSADGATFGTAAEGTLSGAATVTPTANASGVRYVRLQALAPQDAAQPTIDLAELQVQGVGPNTPPAGTLTVDAPRNYIKSTVRLHAAFTDGDSTITRYLWDFDGDGRWDQATLGPNVAHVWLKAATYHVTVGVRDFRGGLGTASLDLRLTDPDQPLEPVIQRKPLITFDPVDGIDLPARIACSSKCTFSVTFVITKRMAKSIKSPRRTILTFKRKTAGPGLGSWTLTLPSKTIRLLRKAHKKKVNVRLTASAVDQQKRRTTVHRWVTFR
jgi:hypothetical protein